MRNGKPVSGTMPQGTPLTYGVATIGLAGIVAVPDKPDPDPVWCSERELTAGTLTLRIWRNTGAVAASTSVQRITVAGRNVTMDVVFSGFASAVLNKELDAAPETWRAHLLFGTYNGRPAIYATFDNEPDAKVIAPLVADIVAGKLKPVVHVNEQGVFMLGAPPK